MTSPHRDPREAGQWKPEWHLYDHANDEVRTLQFRDEVQLQIIVGKSGPQRKAAEALVAAANRRMPSEDELFKVLAPSVLGSTLNVECAVSAVMALFDSPGAGAEQEPERSNLEAAVEQDQCAFVYDDGMECLGQRRAHDASVQHAFVPPGTSPSPDALCGFVYSAEKNHWTNGMECKIARRYHDGLKHAFVEPRPAAGPEKPKSSKECGHIACLATSPVCILKPAPSPLAEPKPEPLQCAKCFAMYERPIGYDHIPHDCPPKPEQVHDSAPVTVGYLNERLAALAQPKPQDALREAVEARRAQTLAELRSQRECMHEGCAMDNHGLTWRLRLLYDILIAERREIAALEREASR